MISPIQLKAVFSRCRNPTVWTRVFNKILPAFGLDKPNRLCMFLAQTGYESEDFNVLRENLAYRTTEHLRDAFPHEFPTDESALKYVANPVGLANFLYANKNGNGELSTGDGWKYRGGGLIQLTGRGNYAAVGKALMLDLEVRPSQIILEDIACKTAAFFWTQNDLNAAADAGDFDHTTRRINGSAMLGADARKALWERLKAQNVT